MSIEIDELKERIQEVEQERNELQSELDDHSNELSNREQEGYDMAMLDMESKIQHAFYAGWKACTDKAATPLKSLLNYNMEQRL